MKTIIIILTFFIFAFETLSQTTYIWSGAVNSNFSTAGNWNPVRQIGLVSDKLVFNNGAALDISNVYQVTVGQVSVLNNTHLKLSPSPGNPKILFIQGDEETLKPGENQKLTDLKYHEYMDSETRDISDVKYTEYMRSDSSELASLKYNEYTRPDSADIAAVKYNEYKNPPVTGMGDVKNEGGFDSNNNSDLLIESGSSLTIHGSDPKLSVFLKQNATAEINGSLILTGPAQNEINSTDPFAISFKDGSSLIQSCPGRAFSNSGTLNSVNFENGSKLIINHAGALNPFAMNQPASKVNFESSSLIEFNVCGSNAISINGRQLPNLKINNGCILDINEFLNADISVNNIDINTGGKLSINNLADNSVPDMNVKGNLNVNGELRFPENWKYKLNLNFNGGNNQLISGSGVIDLNTGINKMHIYNDITLNCDLSAYCTVHHHEGFINTNGNTFRLFNQYISYQPLFPGMIIISELLMSSEKDKNEPNDKDTLPGNTASNSPREFFVSQNYPNPFNPITKIRLYLPKAGNLLVAVYDITGKEVSRLSDGYAVSGNHELTFNASDLSSGVYFYTVKAQSYKSVTYKMILTK